MVIMLKVMRRIDNIFFKRLIMLIFFFLPGGFILLSIMIFINEIFINDDIEENVESVLPKSKNP